jgi:hypothetical protein
MKTKAKSGKIKSGFKGGMGNGIGTLFFPAAAKTAFSLSAF